MSDSKNPIINKTKKILVNPKEKQSELKNAVKGKLGLPKKEEQIAIRRKNLDTIKNRGKDIGIELHPSHLTNPEAEIKVLSYCDKQGNPIGKKTALELFRKKGAKINKAVFFLDPNALINGSAESEFANEYKINKDDGSITYKGKESSPRDEIEIDGKTFSTVSIGSFSINNKKFTICTTESPKVIIGLQKEKNGKTIWLPVEDPERIANYDLFCKEIGIEKSIMLESGIEHTGHFNQKSVSNNIVGNVLKYFQSNKEYKYFQSNKGYSKHKTDQYLLKNLPDHNPIGMDEDIIGDDGKSVYKIHTRTIDGMNETLKNDGGELKMSKSIKKMNELINLVGKSNSIMINCNAGLNRSSAVACAILLKSGVNISDVCKKLDTKFDLKNLIKDLKDPSTQKDAREKLFNLALNKDLRLHILKDKLIEGKLPHGNSNVFQNLEILTFGIIQEMERGNAKEKIEKITGLIDDVMRKGLSVETDNVTGQDKKKYRKLFNEPNNGRKIRER